MKNAKQTLVLFQSSTIKNKICAEITECESITYWSAESMIQLQDLIDQNQVPLIFAQAPQLPLVLTVTKLRALVGLGSLIVVTDTGSSTQVSETLSAGADVVVAGETLTHTELLAWSSALLRRTEAFLHNQASGRDSAEGALLVGPAGGRTAREPLPPWRLVDGGWRLLTPSGESCNLTSSERFFLESFVGQVDKRVSREELLQQSPSLNQDSRAIDSLISRLRRKVQAKKQYLPIKAIHGWGYSFTELLLGDELEAVDAEAAHKIEPAFIAELSTRAQFEQQLEQERFEFMFQPLSDTSNHRVVGAFVVLVWKDQQGQQTRVEHLVPHLASIHVLDSLIDWCIVKLNHELKAWEELYEAYIPLYVGIPAELLIQKYSQIDKYASPSIANKLTIIVQGLTHAVDLDSLHEVITKLKVKGIAIWARYENADLLSILQLDLGFDGVSFWRLTDNLIRGEGSQCLSRTLDFVQQKNWPTLVVDVDNIEQRRFTDFLAIRYVTGSMIAMELSRDGLLLSWASHQTKTH